MVKHTPRIEPKFHQIDRLIGAGRSRRPCLSVVYSGFGVFSGFIIFYRKTGLRVIGEGAQGSGGAAANFYH